MTTAPEFTEAERRALAPFFTNVDEPVFGLKLPQEVAGALFSRYSRTAKSLRRVFLDEFLGSGYVAAEPGTGGAAADAGASVKKAREFYDRVLIGYGDDSVAQLGGAHVACERISNVAAKLLEDARIGVAFLEKSTRYVRFDQRDAEGSWLYHREARVLASPHREAYLALMETLFSTYARQMDPMIEFIERSLPIEKVELRHPASGEPLEWRDVKDHPELGPWAQRAYLTTVKAHACDVMRSYLPGATLTNVGVFATGQAFEYLLTKLWSQELAEGQALAEAMHRELSFLIPSFVKRARRSEYLAGAADLVRGYAERLPETPSPAPPVALVDVDGEAEEKVLAALLYPATRQPLPVLRAWARTLDPVDRRAILDEVAYRRRNRRDKPGRALESVSYTFDLLANFGIYRDLQRHRILTQQRQDFTTAHGYDTPPEIEETGFRPAFDECMGRAHDVHEKLRREMPLEAQYVVPFAYRVRWYVRLNLREAVHLFELRSMPQGHPDYRRVVQEMWRKIEEAHPSLSGWARFVNRHTYRLGRLQSELKTEYKRSALG